MDDESGDVPRHHKHAHRRTHQYHTRKVDLPEALRRKEKGRCTKVRSKMFGDYQYQYQPETKQQLVLTEMQQQQLHRQKVVYIPKCTFHPVAAGFNFNLQIFWQRL